jgi:prepilin-type N-terminal cleavage/methylation domain-containing protein
MMTRTSTSRRSRRRATLGYAVLGYTVIEVMMALAVLSIGATGVIAMQKATLIGNVRARNLATANAVASAWIERLRVDGLRWKVIDGQSTLTDTRWLQTAGAWFPPTAVSAEDISPQADVLGRDTFTTADAAYCTHLRLTQITDNTMRAEVRVFWLRYGDVQGASDTGTFDAAAVCSTAPSYVTKVGTAAALLRYHFVYLATAVIRSN